MKRFVAVLGGVFAIIAVAPAAMAQSAEEEIIAAQHAHFETLRAGDARAHIAQHAPDATSFDAVGGLLVEAQSQEEQVRDLQAVFDAGIGLDNYLRHVQVRIYGDAAVVTGYITGTTTYPDGVVLQTMNRRTAVLIKQGGEWKEVHSHASPVVGAQPE
jgi:ketosteroid isomerase-like protein